MFVIYDNIFQIDADDRVDGNEIGNKEQIQRRADHVEL